MTTSMDAWEFVRSNRLLGALIKEGVNSDVARLIVQATEVGLEGYEILDYTIRFCPNCGLELSKEQSGPYSPPDDDRHCDQCDFHFTCIEFKK